MIKFSFSGNYHIYPGMVLGYLIFIFKSLRLLFSIPSYIGPVHAKRTAASIANALPWHALIYKQT